MEDWNQLIEEGREAEIIAMIRSGQLPVDARDGYDQTPLLAAAENCRPALATALLSLGAQPNRKRDDGETCLSLAIEASCMEVLRLLVDAGADMEMEATNYHTPLALAVVRGNAEAIRYLLEKGANIEARGEMEETPLIEAAFFGQAEAASLLLEAGADITATDGFGDNAVAHASKRGDDAVLTVLKAFRPRARARQTHHDSTAGGPSTGAGRRRK